jgi:ribosomal protein S18 acetylase RimI-like enzyme
MRPYADEDLPRLLDTVAGWIEQAGRCGYDHVGELPHRIYENLRGRRHVGDLVRLWEAGGTIAGVEINGRFGVAFDVLAAPALRGSQAERSMLVSGYQTTASLIGPQAGPFVLTDVFDCDAARIRLLTGLGFEQFRCWDHVRERDLRDLPGPPGPRDGYLLRSARLQDAGQLAAARNESFDENWTGDLYRSAVMEKPGYDPSREIVAETADGRIAAFAVYWVDERNKTGHFEPVGTHRDFQRQGLARAVMLAAMRQMRELGVTLVTVNHLAENLAARRLYETLGFEKRYETLGFRRALPPAAGGPLGPYVP